MIIGLLGFAGSGKGTVGDLLMDYHGYRKDSFAGPLKDATAAIFGWDRGLLEGDTPQSRAWRERPDEFWTEHFEQTFTPRIALQLMGTEAGRNVFHKDLWVISLLHRAQGHSIVVTDVRFKNEVEALKQAGGIMVRVQRGVNPAWFDTAKEANRGDVGAIETMKTLGIHSSEWDWIGCGVDVLIPNNGSLSDLRDRVDALAQSYRA